jgi:hypothetical protein
LDNCVTNQIPLLGRGLGGGLNGKMIITIIEAIPSIKTAYHTTQETKFKPKLGNNKASTNTTFEN